MIITVNTTEKKITISESVSMKELVAELEKMFPNGEWKEYKLEQQKEYISYPSYPSQPYIPSWPLQPFLPLYTEVLCKDGNSVTYTLTENNTVIH